MQRTSTARDPSRDREDGWCFKTEESRDALDDDADKAVAVPVEIERARDKTDRMVNGER